MSGDIAAFINRYMYMYIYILKYKTNFYNEFICQCIILKVKIVLKYLETQRANSHSLSS